MLTPGEGHKMGILSTDSYAQQDGRKVNVFQLLRQNKSNYTE